MTIVRTAVLNSSVLAASLILLSACSADTGDTNPPLPPAAGEETSTQDPSATPTPVAALEMPNGSRVEFYDFGRTALISQTGIAGTPLPLNLERQPRHDELAAVWRSLAPDKAVPEALTRLEQRLVMLPPSEQAVEPSIVAERGDMPTTPDPNGDLLEFQDGCANGCCDYAWLSTISYCQSGGDYNYFRFMWVWYSLYTPEVHRHKSLVCAAIGTSEYKVQLAGKSKAWSVPEGWYRTHDWTGATFCTLPFVCDDEERGVLLTVNTEANPHKHSVCAKAWH